MQPDITINYGISIPSIIALLGVIVFVSIPPVYRTVISPLSITIHNGTHMVLYAFKRKQGAPSTVGYHSNNDMGRWYAEYYRSPFGKIINYTVPYILPLTFSAMAIVLSGTPSYYPMMAVAFLLISSMFFFAMSASPHGKRQFWYGTVSLLFFAGCLLFPFVNGEVITVVVRSAAYLVFLGTCLLLLDDYASSPSPKVVRARVWRGDDTGVLNTGDIKMLTALPGSSRLKSLLMIMAGTITPVISLVIGMFLFG